MPELRRDRRSKAPDDWGKPGLSFPYADANYPQLIETQTARQIQTKPTFGSANPNSSYTNLILTGAIYSQGENTDANWTLKYETIPGPTLNSTHIDEDGIPVNVATTKVLASSIASGETYSSPTWTKTTKQPLEDNDFLANKVVETRAIPGPWISVMPETDPIDGVLLVVNKRLQDVTLIALGESAVPSSLTPIAVSAIGTADPITGIAVVTLVSSHSLSVGNWAQFTATDSTPTLPVSTQVVSVPAANQVGVLFPVTVAGTMGTMTPLWLRTYKDEIPTSTKVAWEVAKTRVLPGPQRDTSHPGEDGVWVNEYKTVNAPGAFTDSEPDIGGDNLWNRISREMIPGTSKIVFQVVSSRVIPGLGHVSTKTFEDGIRGTITETFKAIGAISVGEGVASNVWSATDEQAVEGSSKVAKEIVLSRSVPGPWIPSVPELDPIDGVTLAVNKRLQDVNLIQSGEGIVPTSTAAINVSSITTGTAGSSNPTVTVASAHGLSAGMWVQFLNTNSTPSLGLSLQVVTAPTSTTITVAVTVTNAGTMAGTMTPLWPRTTKVAFQDSIAMAWETVKTRPLPGPSLPSTKRDEDGVLWAIGTQVQALPVSTPETLSAGSWNRVDEDTIPGSSKIGRAVSQTRTIPGPFIPAEPEEDPLDGVPLHVFKRLQDSNAIVPGESAVPSPSVAVNISSITNTNPCTVTTGSAHGLTAGMWVNLLGTNSTPTLPVAAQVASAPTTTTFTLAFAVTVAGTTAGTAQPLWARTTRVAHPDTTIIAWETVKLRTLPGPPRYDKMRDPDGTTINITRTVKDQSTITSLEADSSNGASSGTWTDTDQQAIPGTSKIAYEVVKSRPLPGPIVTEVAVHNGPNIPILISRQKVSSSILWQEGELVPAAINVSSITTGTQVTVTLASDHGLPIGAWVAFAGGTASTPSLDGQTLQIQGTPNTNQVFVTPANPVTVAGTSGGTMQAVNRIVRELKPTSIRAKASLIKIKVESMLAVPDVTVFNEDIACWKNFPFPDFLKPPNLYIDSSLRDASGSEFMLNTSWDGILSEAKQAGYKGPCRARRRRYFFDGPPPDSFTAGVTVTISHASPAVVGWTNHGLVVGNPVQFSTTGALPPGLSTYTTYYVASVIDANDFTVSATNGGSAINTTGAGSGTQTAYRFAPTFILLSRGTAAIEGGSSSSSGSLTSGATSYGISNKWKVQYIGECLTGPSPSFTTVGSSYVSVNISGVNIGSPTAPIVATSTAYNIPASDPYVVIKGSTTTPSIDGRWRIASYVDTTHFQLATTFSVTNAGSGGGTAQYANQAFCTLDIPQSIPAKFNQGDIIVLVEQPQKLGVAGLWQVYVWLITVPYTSGNAPT